MNIDVTRLAPYAKAVVAGLTWLGTVLAVFVSVSADGNLSAEDVTTLLVALLGGGAATAGVYQVRNTEADE
jgi:hypothetical protein